MNRTTGKSIARLSVLSTALLLPLAAAAWGQARSVEFQPLKGVKPPLPDLTGIVVDRNAAIALGKALFWDKDVGSDGQACATCHFHAGADTRITNQINPGLKGGKTAFGDANGLMKSGSPSGPNYTLKPEDFPFHLLMDPANRDSAVLFDDADVVSSSGTYGSPFKRVRPRADTLTAAPGTSTYGLDTCSTGGLDPIFHTAWGNTRHVEPRNTPTTINAVFNFRNFWDGRANNVFNGADPFGPRSPAARVFVKKTMTSLAAEKLALVDASLASQAVGPALSDFEMSCAGRTFADLGKKLLQQVGLGSQAVAPNDSVLAPYRSSTGKGLVKRYQELVKAAFDPKYWSALGAYKVGSTGVVPSATGYTHAELNFSMFWGISIMLYESTLISDQSPYDDFLTKRDTSRFGQLEQDGMQVFQGKGQCVACHRGPTLTSAALTLALPRAILEEMEEPPEDKLIERMSMGNIGVALYDNGFYNIGVRPAEEDIGLGGLDPWGNPLSYTRQFKKNPANVGPDKFNVDPCDFAIPTGPLTCGADLTTVDLSKERVAVDGTFKVPSLRNIAQTPPYFHNGGQATLRQVVEFYSRGGDRRSLDPSKVSYAEPSLAKHDTTGTGPLGEGVGADGKRGSNLAADIEPLGLLDYEKDALVAFLQSLTDDRVRCHMAPFDHPELPMSVGALNADANADGRADEIVKTLVATGVSGIAGCSIPNDGDLFTLSPKLDAQAFK
jgi:cytochrome c peroxidase